MLELLFIKSASAQLKCMVREVLMYVSTLSLVISMLTVEAARRLLALSTKRVPNPDQVGVVKV